MKITFDEHEKSIEIKDGLKTQYFILNFILALNIFNAIMNLYNMDDKQLNWIGFIWIFVGAISFGVLIYAILKKTAVEKIPVEQISRLREKKFLGRKRFSIALKNGKFRDLFKIKNKADIRQLKTLFEEIGINIA